MNPELAGVGALLVSLLAALWSGLLALSQDSHTAAGTDTSRPSRGERVYTYDAIQIVRIVLLLLSGAGAAHVLRWWERTGLDQAVAVLVPLGLLYMVGEALPRAMSVLAPEMSNHVVPLARKSLAPFQPLMTLGFSVQQSLNRLLHPVSSLKPDDSSGHRDITLGVYSLGTTTVEDIMTPRIDIAALDTDASWNEMLEAIRKHDYARLPVYTNDLDEISGVLFAKDLVPIVSGISPVPDKWQDLIRPARFVPESKTLASQLRDFQRQRGNLAIVVDEFGGTAGLITLEDILEEVVGEIRDEYDIDEQPAVQQEGDSKFWIDGRVTVDELSAVLGLTVEDDEINTLGGLIYTELGRVPRPGEELRLGDYRVVVEKVVRRAIRRVYFERVDNPEEPDEGEST